MQVQVKELRSEYQYLDTTTDPGMYVSECGHWLALVGAEKRGGAIGFGITLRSTPQRTQVFHNRTSKRYKFVKPLSEVTIS
jgi:hypothetical protein